LRSYLHPLPQVLHAPATALDQVRNTLGYSRVLSGTHRVLAELHTLACAPFLYVGTHRYSRGLTGLTRTHGVLCVGAGRAARAGVRAFSRGEGRDRRGVVDASPAALLRWAGRGYSGVPAKAALPIHADRRKQTKRRRPIRSAAVDAFATRALRLAASCRLQYGTGTRSTRLSPRVSTRSMPRGSVRPREYSEYAEAPVRPRRPPAALRLGRARVRPRKEGAHSHLSADPFPLKCRSIPT
jgi:hypothetical protein